MKRSILNLFNEIIVRENALWNEDEASLYFDTSNRSEGPGEKSYRRKHGLDETKAGSAYELDVPELNNVELKSIVVLKAIKPSKKFPMERLTEAMCAFRAGSGACKQLSKATVLAAWTVGKLNLDESILDLLMSSLSSKQRALMPKEISSIIEEHIRPSTALLEYTGGIECMSPKGHMYVSVNDYDDAFVLSSVTKGLVKFKLSKNYLERRLDTLNAV